MITNAEAAIIAKTFDETMVERDRVVAAAERARIVKILRGVVEQSPMFHETECLDALLTALYALEKGEL